MQLLNNKYQCQWKLITHGINTTFSLKWLARKYLNFVLWRSPVYFCICSKQQPCGHFAVVHHIPSKTTDDVRLDKIQITQKIHKIEGVTNRYKNLPPKNRIFKPKFQGTISFVWNRNRFCILKFLFMYPSGIGMSVFFKSAKISKGSRCQQPAWKSVPWEAPDN